MVMVVSLNLAPHLGEYLHISHTGRDDLRKVLGFHSAILYPPRTPTHFSTLVELEFNSDPPSRPPSQSTESCAQASRLDHNLRTKTLPLVSLTFGPSRFWQRCLPALVAEACAKSSRLRLIPDSRQTNIDSTFRVSITFGDTQKRVSTINQLFLSRKRQAADPSSILASTASESSRLPTPSTINSEDALL